MSLLPSVVTARATQTGRLETLPSRTFPWMQPMSTTGYTGSSSQFRHTTIPSRTLPVILAITLFETSGPYVSARRALMHPRVIPRADKYSTIFSIDSSLRCYFPSIFGSRLPTLGRAAR